MHPLRIQREGSAEDIEEILPLGREMKLAPIVSQRSFRLRMKNSRVDTGCFCARILGPSVKHENAVEEPQ